MEPIERFFWWIEERHRIYEKRKMGVPQHLWTDDEILQRYRFTNPFRENDKTTVWFRKNIREPLRNDDRVFMATVIFRWFNLIETGKTLVDNNLHLEWNSELAREKIKKQDRYVTGGYIIKTPDGMDKVDGVIWCIEKVLKNQKDLIMFTKEEPTLEATWELFLEYPYLGPFMSYELVTDLRHTHFLENAKDINTWANAGPGAMRGLNRVFGRRLNYKSRKNNWVEEMQALLAISDKHLSEFIPKLELRDIEHSLCEFDKYERARKGEGKPRGRFRCE